MRLSSIRSSRQGVKTIHILGISAFYHDSAAALLCNGEIVAAAQEERFTRRKYDAAFPKNAITFCLDRAGLTLDDIDHVIFYEKPFLKLERLLETYVAFAPRGFRSFRKAIPVWAKEKLFQKKLLADFLADLSGKDDWKSRLLFAEHHQSHAASAFYPSPFTDAIVLTMDGVGEWATTSVSIGRGNSLETIREIHYPHSLGLLYSAFTYYTGFKVNSGEYKMMGLASYGQPRFAQVILDHLIDVKDDGSYRLNQKYFNYCSGLTMTNGAFNKLFGGRPRHPDEPLTQRHMDLAASIQAVSEEVVLRITKALAREGHARNLCLAGGVSLNCMANGKILRHNDFENIWIQPAAGDAGGALGAAYVAYHRFLEKPRIPMADDHMQGSLLGPEYNQPEIEQRLLAAGAQFVSQKDDALFEQVVAALVAGKAVGWFQGRMEFGPRALGARSILGDPRSPAMQRTLNLKVKFRKSFRPFAPAILREDAAEWFELPVESPYMLMVADICKHLRREMTPEEQELFGLNKLHVPRSTVPAVTHVDYSARVQTVDADVQPRFHALISRFKEATGCPMLVNTSFNVRGEPIVCTPEDAFRCFMGTEIDVLAIGNCLLKKEEQDPSLKSNYQNTFTPD